MKILIVLLACMVLSGCSLFSKSGKSKPAAPTAGMLSPEAEMTMPPVSAAVYELYSWKDGTDWHYALFKFSDAPRNFESITASPEVLSADSALLEKISALPKGSQVYWNFRRINGCLLPAEEVQSRIYSAARAAAVSMDIIRR